MAPSSHVDPEAIALVAPPVGLAFVGCAEVAERTLQDLWVGTGGFLLKVDDGADRDSIFRRNKARMKSDVLLGDKGAIAHVAGAHEEGVLVNALARFGGKECCDPEFHLGIKSWAKGVASAAVAPASATAAARPGRRSACR